MMASEKICKTVHQYNKCPISPEDMRRLQEIASDYCKVKNHVYSRYGGISSLSKLYPGYTVQKEMASTGIREELGLPSVYFNLAILDAVGDIKNQWTRLKSEVSNCVDAHGGFTDEEKHYLRFLLKVSNAFEMVVNRQKVVMKKDIQLQYDILASAVDAHRLNNYLCRQVRKRMVRLNTESKDGFALSERAYRYSDHGIYITVKEKRKRVFVPLTDNNQYSRQIYIKLYPDRDDLEIKIPVDVEVKHHEEYISQVGLALGIYTMLVTDQGHRYGEGLGELSLELADWVWDQNSKYMKNIHTNPGRKKYTAKKRRKTERLHSYINMELNRFIREEKPGIIYIPQLPRSYKHEGDRKINHSVTMWQRGYIRKQLRQKCMEQSIEFVEVFGKNISNQCSSCGAMGIKDNRMFRCQTCGLCIDTKINTAINAKNRGSNPEQ